MNYSGANSESESESDGNDDEENNNENNVAFFTKIGTSYIAITIVLNGVFWQNMSPVEINVVSLITTTNTRENITLKACRLQHR
jgi:hypothetical protein